MSTFEASINNVDLFFSDEIDQHVIDEIIELIEPELDNLHDAIFNTLSESDIAFNDVVEFDISSSHLFDIVSESEQLDSEVIGHYNAIKILSERDSSLQHSVNLAVESGFSLENVNSELLATLLVGEDSREAVGSVNFDEITEALDSTYFNVEIIADKWSIYCNFSDIDIDKCAFSIEFYFNK